jgi:hypothetical protein
MRRAPVVSAMASPGHTLASTIVLGTAIAGCGGPDDTVAGHKPAMTSGRLVIHENRAAGPMYIEGSVSFLRVEAMRPGQRAETQRTPGVAPGGRTLIFDERLPPGAYRLVSYQRPCAGNCDYLDPPTDRCETVLHIRADETRRLTLVLRPGAGCRVREAS